MCVDDISRYTWIDFLINKSDTFEAFRMICLNLLTEKSTTLKQLRSDHCKEFENTLFSDFCEAYGIKHEFSAAKLPQQYGVVEKKNRTI